MKTDTSLPHGDPAPAASPQEETKKCVRCGLTAEVDEDGFCTACAKAVEQACL